MAVDPATILRRMTVLPVVLVLLFGASSVFAQPKPKRSASGDAQYEVLIRIPREGTLNGMLTRICRPRSADPAPLVVINHGSPPSSADRPKRKPSSCGEVAQHFTSRGYAVAFPLRRGYGETGGAWAETYGRCNSAEFLSAGKETADDIETAIDHLLSLPFIAKTSVIVIGQSAGGWGTLALASRNPARVAALINFAGGRGARKLPDGAYSNCSPDRLIASAAEFGKTAQQQTLWIYSENDRLIGPDLSRRMHAAFTAAGGKARYELLPAFGSDGHTLFFGRGGSSIWGPIIERWIANPAVLER